MKRYILLLGLLLLFGCLDTGNGTPAPGTQATGLKAQYGDTVTVDYTLTVSGKVMDTSSIDTAKSAGIYNENRSYQPYSFKMLIGANTIPGFVNGVLGMKEGETKSFTVAPADGYGLADPALITNMSRYYNKSVFEVVPKAFFDSANVSVENGTVIPQDIGYIGIHNVSNDTVTIRYLFSPGHKFAMHGLPQTVASITNDTMLIRFDLEEGQSFMLTDPYTQEQSLARVTYADNKTILLDENPPLAGKELYFEVTVLSISRPAS